MNIYSSNFVSNKECKASGAAARTPPCNIYSVEEPRANRTIIDITLCVVILNVL